MKHQKQVPKKHFNRRLNKDTIQRVMSIKNMLSLKEKREYTVDETTEHLLALGADLAEKQLTA